MEIKKAHDNALLYKSNGSKMCFQKSQHLLVLSQQEEISQIFVFDNNNSGRCKRTTSEILNRAVNTLTNSYEKKELSGPLCFTGLS